MLRMTRWIGQVGAVLLFAGMTACGDVVVPTQAPDDATTLAPSEGANRDYNPCPGGPNNCDGDTGGGGSGSNGNIQLIYFEDKLGGTSSNDYEFRQTTYRGSSATGYNRIRAHGNSWTSGEFTVVNTGLFMPCYNGKLHLALWDGTWGATTWNWVGGIDITSSDNGAARSFYNYATGSYAYVVYRWSTCV